MERQPDIMRVLTRDRIADLFATASRSQPHLRSSSRWRALFGSALVHLGKTLLHEPRATAGTASFGPVAIR